MTKKAVASRMDDLFNDMMLVDSGDLIAGVDEAGRGPLAGAVYAAAVILNPDEPIEGLRDSKKLTAKRRDELAEEIKAKALCWCVADASVEEIEEMNILKATMLAMRRAVLGLRIEPKLVLVDGNRLPEVPYPANAIVKGDDKVMCANVDLYSGLVYKVLKIPEDLFTPLFATARIAGWCAHRLEELISGGRIMRPAYKSVSHTRTYIAPADREVQG